MTPSASSGYFSVVPNYERELAVSAATIVGSLEIRPGGLLFHCDLAGTLVQCGICEAALRDLIDFHDVPASEDETLRAVLSEIRRIVSTKYRAGRFEEGGAVIVWPADLLRYGYWQRANAAA